MLKHRAWLIASALLISSTAGCGKQGVVEQHRIPGSETPPPPDAGAENDADGGEDMSGDGAAGACPDGFMCMDITALGFSATDGDGNPVTASCSMGATPTMCDDADPAATCEGLSKPFCAHLKVGAQDIVSCAQRCTP